MQEYDLDDDMAVAEQTEQEPQASAHAEVEAEIEVEARAQALTEEQNAEQSQAPAEEDSQEEPAAEPEPVGYEMVKKIIEGAILAADEPLTIKQIRHLFARGAMPEKDEVEAALEDLQQDYNERGIELKQVASGYRFQVAQDLAPWIGKLWQEKPARYTRATLETLVLIAYRQPVTRAEIEDVRGVAVSSQIIRSLMERGWVRIVGHRDVPGRPGLYATTKDFLDYFNLKGLKDLPTLEELRDLDEMARELEDQAEQAQDVAVQQALDDAQGASDDEVQFEEVATDVSHNIEAEVEAEVEVEVENK